jgi:hypothetical protein
MGGSGYAVTSPRLAPYSPGNSLSFVRQASASPWSRVLRLRARAVRVSTRLASGEPCVDGRREPAPPLGHGVRCARFPQRPDCECPRRRGMRVLADRSTSRAGDAWLLLPRHEFSPRLMNVRTPAFRPPYRFVLLGATSKRDAASSRPSRTAATKACSSPTKGYWAAASRCTRAPAQAERNSSMLSITRLGALILAVAILVLAYGLTVA